MFLPNGSIEIDKRIPPTYGYVRYPKRGICFSTADIHLESTPYLILRAEECAEGYPDVSFLKYCLKNFDYMDYHEYRFVAEINDRVPGGIDVSISATEDDLIEWGEPCGGADSYRISFTEDEKSTIVSRLDKQCRQYWGKSCKRMLMEAKRDMCA